MIVYHGSDHIVEKPVYHAGTRRNDYGYGFYCTAYEDMAKEWSVTEGRSGYALRIYRADGSLVEDYARADAALRPEDAQIIGATETFDPVLTADGLLTVNCDAGKVLLHLRSGEAGA